MDEQSVRLALLRKAFQSDWDGAAPSAPSSNGCARYQFLGSHCDSGHITMPVVIARQTLVHLHVKR